MKKVIDRKERLRKERIYGLVFKIILFPFILLFLPFTLILKTIVTIGQPYFLNKSQNQWLEFHRKLTKKGGSVDYPPKVGTIFGVKPWGYSDDKDED